MRYWCLFPKKPKKYWDITTLCYAHCPGWQLERRVQSSFVTSQHCLVSFWRHTSEISWDLGSLSNYVARPFIRIVCCNVKVQRIRSVHIWMYIIHRYNNKLWKEFHPATSVKWDTVHMSINIQIIVTYQIVLKSHWIKE